jgi:outer membrane protein OmpA-like peptidoglycan-associated protein
MYTFYYFYIKKYIILLYFIQLKIYKLAKSTDTKSMKKLLFKIFNTDKTAFIFICLIFTTLPFVAQIPKSISTDTTISYTKSGSYWMVERSNFSRYDNGSYTGHTSREVRSFVHPISPPSNCASMYRQDTWFDGSFMVDEKTLHNYTSVTAGLDGSIPARFHISQNGTVIPIIDNGFPTFRSFPAYPSGAVKSGDSWIAKGERAVDPLNKGIYTKLPITVQYTFRGKEDYKGQTVYRIHAQWATRYGMQWLDVTGDPDLQEAQGKHEADILVLPNTGAAFVISDYVDETFIYLGNKTVRFRGTLTLFTEFPPSIDTDKLLPAFEKIATIKTGSIEPQFNPETLLAGSEGIISDRDEGMLDETVISLKNNMIVEKTPAGLRLSVRDAHFKPNSPEFEEGETLRLDAIAKTLMQVPDAMFLIEGHTAAIGIEEGELELSLARAKHTAQELEKRGISADNFICKGLGRDYPVATNDTVEGRAQNRRVEITILQ